MKGFRLALCLAALLGCEATAAAPAPQRIVSMNLCLDSVLVELVPHEHILALSQYSRDPWRSTIAEIARDLPYTNETAEEVVALKPDLVITSRHSAIATRNALRRVGVRFELFVILRSEIFTGSSSGTNCSKSIVIPRDSCSNREYPWPWRTQ